MASFRSTRLEAVLGAAIDAALPYAALVALKTNQVTEATDLDYKREHYKNNDPKRALCGDIAAMANAAGGVILLGIAEDTRTSAAEDLVNVALGDDQIRRIRSIAASGIAPLPSFEVFPIADPADPGNGIIVIAVPQSPMRPHAVLVNDGFRFPVRNGTGTLYLTEAQVADAYRRRARRLDEGVAALERLERHMLDQMHGQDIVYVAVTLMPDVPGYFQLDAARFRAFRQEVTGCPAILDSNFYWERHRVASGRLIASGGTEEKPRYLGCELYQDGSGSFATAVALADQPPPGRPEGRVYVLDERVVDAIWSGARFLARHARDRAAVGGNAGVRVTVSPASPDLPVQLYHPRHHGFPDSIGFAVEEPPVAEGVFDIADLAQDGPPLVAATYRLASDIFQGFGRPETVQMTADGMLRRKYWSTHVYGPKLAAWAAGAGIEMTDEIVDGF